MKLKHFLPLLLLTISLTACVETTTITRMEGQNTITPQFSTDREDLKRKIAAVIPAEDILISSGNTKKLGVEEYNFLTVEIVSPESFPSGFSFSNLANEISKVVKDDLKNLEDYQKVKIEVRNTVEENNTEHTRTYKKEIDL